MEGQKTKAMTTNNDDGGAGALLGQLTHNNKENKQMNQLHQIPTSQNDSKYKISFKYVFILEFE